MKTQKTTSASDMSVQALTSSHNQLDEMANSCRQPETDSLAKAGFATARDLKARKMELKEEILRRADRGDSTAYQYAVKRFWVKQATEATA